MAIKASEQIWFNGKLIPWNDAKLHVMSHVVNYGSSVFEGMRCYQTEKGPAVFRLRDHIQRLLDSAKVYRMEIDYSLDELIHALNPILRGWTNYYRHAASKRCFAYLNHYLWWRVIRWLRKKYPRLTWKQLRRRCWGRDWTSREGTRLAWPAEVPVTRYRYRGHRIPSPWAASTGTGRATTPPEPANA